MKEKEKKALLCLGYFPDVELPLSQQKPDVLLAMMTLGEAGGEPFSAKLAVGCVARNRVLRPKWPNDWVNVLIQHKAFQGLMSVEEFYKTFNRRTTIDNWMACMVAAQLVMFDGCYDITDGSIFFIDYRGTKKLPKWLDWRRLQVRYGNLFFFEATDEAVQMFLRAT